MKKLWRKIRYTVFPTTYSCILLLVILAGSVSLGVFYKEESGQILQAAEENRLRTESYQEQKAYQEQESSAWIELYSEFWGISIAVIIFLLEISRNYSYGLSLKRIVNFSVGPVMTALAGICLVLLCPFAYWCESTHRYKTLFATAVFSIVLLGLGIVFWVRFSMRKPIRKLTKKRSRKQILQIRELFFSENIPRLNDSLLLREVIEHTDYTNIREWENMAAVISQCITDKNVKRCLTGTLAEHTLLKAITNHIIYKSGVEPEYVLNQTVDILDLLLKNIIQRLEDDFGRQLNKAGSESEKEKRIVSFTLQVMLPFFDYHSHNSIKAFLNLWERYKQYQMEIVPYIFLYLYYKNHYGDGISQEYWQTLSRNESFRFCQEHRKYWDADRKLALELWVDWEQYNGNGMVRGLTELHIFMNRLEDAQYYPSEKLIIPEYL